MSTLKGPPDTTVPKEETELRRWKEPQVRVLRSLVFTARP